MDTGKKLLSLSPATEAVRNYCVPLEECTERPLRMAHSRVAQALRETVRVLRIMVSLHSAEDYPSVLRLYGLESLPATE